MHDKYRSETGTSSSFYLIYVGHSRTGSWTASQTHTQISKQKRNRTKHTYINTQHVWIAHIRIKNWCILSYFFFFFFGIRIFLLRHLFVCLRVEFLLKTDSGYPKDKGVTLFTVATPGNPLRYNTHWSAPPVSARAHSRGPRKRSQSPVSRTRTSSHVWTGPDL